MQQARKNANKTATRLIANGCLCFAAMLLLLLHVVVAAVVVAVVAAFVAVKTVVVAAAAFVVCCYCCSCLLQLLLVMLLLLVLFVRWGPLSLLLLLFVVCFMHPLVTFRLPFSTLFAPFICPMHIYLSQLSFAF